MIPSTNIDSERNIEIIQEPTRTYRLDYNNARAVGYNDSVEAMKQAIYKILNTERYNHTIYSWNYGIELSDLFGKPKTYAYPEIKRRITEALTQDDRIQSVDAFSFVSKGREVAVTFTVHTDFGDMEAERTVHI